MKINLRSLLILWIVFFIASAQDQRSTQIELTGTRFLTRELNFPPLGYGLTEFQANFSERLGVATGYFCPAPYDNTSWPAMCSGGYYCLQDCQLGCDYSSQDPSQCGQINSKFVRYSDCQDFVCPTTAGREQLPMCDYQRETWIDLSPMAGSRTAPAKLLAGYVQSYRLFIPDMLNGVALSFEVISGMLSAFASLDTISPIENSTTVYSKSGMRGASIFSICPTSRHWGSYGTGGTLFFDVVAVEDAVFSIFVNDSVPMVPASAAAKSCTDSAICELQDSQLAVCTDACLDTIFEYHYSSSSSAIASSNTSCYPIAIKYISNGNGLVSHYLSKTLAYGLKDTTAEMTFSDELTMFICPGETIYIRPNENNADPFILEITTQANFEMIDLAETNFYSVALSHLLKTVIAECPTSGSPVIYRCDEYQDNFCPFFIAASGQNHSIPWPPIPLLNNNLGIWDQQVADLMHPYFDYSVNARPQGLQWFVWDYSYENTIDFTRISRPDYDWQNCTWRFTSKLVGLDSLTPLPPVQVNVSNFLDTPCTYRGLLEGLPPMSNAINVVLQNATASTLFKIFHLITLSFADPVVISCSNLGYSLFMDIADLKQDIVSSQCYRTTDDPEYDTDPCCSLAAAMEQCCVPRSISPALPVLISNETDISQTCLMKTSCVSSFLDDLSSLQSADLSYGGCSSINVLGEIQSKVSKAYLSKCSQLAFSENQQTGWVCLSDSDCPAGYGCDFFTSSCNITLLEMETRYVECLVGPDSELSLFVLEELKNENGFQSPIRTTEFAQEVQQFYSSDDCVNPKAANLGLGFRSHWLYTTILADCSDYCNKEYNGLDNPPIRCLQQSCDLPEDCQAPYSVCDRYWAYINRTEGECSQIGYTCNWIADGSCSNLGYSDCQDQCLQKPQFCGYCSGDDCVDTRIPVDQCQNYHACASSTGTVEILPIDVDCGYECTRDCYSASTTCTSPLDNGGFCFVPYHLLGPPWSLSCELIAGAIWEPVRGQLDQGICTTDDPPDACQKAGYIWASCEMLDSSNCLTGCKNVTPSCPLPPQAVDQLSCMLLYSAGCTTEEECLTQSGYCEDSEYFINFSENPPVYGACLMPYLTNSDNRRCADKQIPMHLGCVDWSITSESDCVSPGTWMTPVAYGAEEECDNYPIVCNDYTLKNQSECTKCYNSPMDTFEWYQGEWVPQQSKPLSLITPAFVAKYNWTTALDVSALSEKISTLVSLEESFASRSAYLCKIIPNLRVLQVVTCGCAEDAPSTPEVSCFSDSAVGVSGVGLPCFGQEYTLVAPPAVMEFSATALTTETCVPVICEGISVMNYRQTQVVPISSLFSRTRSRKNYEFVNSQSVPVGRVIGDGVYVSSIESLPPLIASSIFNLLIPSTPDSYFTPNYVASYQNVSLFPSPDEKIIARNVSLCVQIDGSLLLTNSSYPVLDFARQKGANNLIPWYLDNVTIQYQYGYLVMCANIPALSFNDSFLPVQRRANPEGYSEPLFETWELGIIYTTAGLYFLVLVLLLYRIGQLIYIGEFFTNQSIFPLCLAIFDIFRGVYFALLGTENLQNLTAQITFILIDIPYFFFFLGMTLLLWWWVSLAWTKNRHAVVRNFRLLTFLSSFIFCSILVVVAVLYSVLYTAPETECDGRTQAPQPSLTNQEILLIVYKSFLCVLTLIGCIGFILTGQKLRSMAMQSVERKVTMITIIAFFSFLGQTIYFIMLAVTDWSTSVYSLIPLWFLEILPQILMMYYQKPTKRAHSQRSSHNSGSRNNSRSGNSSLIELQNPTASHDSGEPFIGEVYTGGDE